MKKMITLLFFAGFLTTAFAQHDRGDRYGNQYNKNYQRDNRQGENGYRHDDQREYRDREYRDRDDRGYRDRDERWRYENYYPQYDNHERMENYYYGHHRDFLRIEIRPGRHDRD
ncbi:MAG: hypothetical protein Q8891_09065 [Bacteroidota bacterium]|nr:hypothetical protein [Bacteroidota bacterium]